MKTFLIILFSTVYFNAFANESNYKLNDQSIDLLFNNSEDITLTILGANTFALSDLSPGAQMNVSNDENKQLTAGLVALGGILLTGGLIGGFIPVHRFILGTNGNGAGIFFGYFCTAGLCGVLPLVDGILLLMDSNGTKYMDNGKWFIWGTK